MLTLANQHFTHLLAVWYGLCVSMMMMMKESENMNGSHTRPKKICYRTFRRNNTFLPNMNTNNFTNKNNLLMTSLFSVPACQRPEGDIDWFPAVDLTETEQEYVFEVDLPGLKADEIQLRADADGLCISGQRVPRLHDGKCLRVERPSGAFVRQLPLPPDAQGEILATFCDGVLELRLTRTPVGRKPEQAQVVPHELNGAVQ